MSEAFTYLDLEEADELAEQLGGLASWAAAGDPEKTAALAQATCDIDTAMPYQGRAYDDAQAGQFPRVAYESLEAGGRDVVEKVWDWDDEEDEAIVPLDVKRAVVHQADAILGGTREERIANQHDGVVYDLAEDGSAESYKQTRGPGVGTGLCRRAFMLMKRYRISSGKML